ncbi:MULTISPECIES: TetR/AcrR family transcriptional regulator [unclassified Janthinobacterium]|uniref:TetR/AcrR family transcriptional regulator n=1 Tax=unclassified Janthinobacterium TaxID=2610881 RepID=UPI00160CC4F0|nr:MULTISPECIES: TetR/AcrR family transcriptional regulator [unclassified Janthinobacterium]MBB5367331.1 AcrR family transcriptional regulator [Janthinobacterium sp. K2C7]MBB5380191.1 AcrR family transcriptional regulator [Janthinobacterium sp. K2Li3]MBB5385713.1 AcrR family transcriptional regulator [Janthinobacterium sp. K2E3]
MVRLAKFNENNFIDSAIAVAAQCGVGAVSMAAIAVKAGAPIGSVYHRFDSRNAILARAWLRVKSDFREEVASLWANGDTWAGVHGMLDWCRRKPVYARFLLQCADSPDFNGALSEELQAALEEEQAALDACFARCAEALPGASELDIDHMLLKFVLIDAPVAVVKPYLTQERPIPASVDAMLRASHDAVRGWAAQTTHTPH